jgi:hypothetical protein
MNAIGFLTYNPIGLNLNHEDIITSFMYACMYDGAIVTIELIVCAFKTTEIIDAIIDMSDESNTTRTKALGGKRKTLRKHKKGKTHKKHKKRLYNHSQ